MAWILLIIGVVFGLVGFRKLFRGDVTQAIGPLAVAFLLALTAAAVRIQTHGWLQ